MYLIVDRARHNPLTCGIVAFTLEFTLETTLANAVNQTVTDNDVSLESAALVDDLTAVNKNWCHT